RTFGGLLIACTVVPFVFACIQGTAPPIDTAILFLATIHVPMTAYLFCDPAIRMMARRRPGVLIVGPLACIAVSFLFTEWLPALLSESWPVVYFFAALFSWQSWHFGKQNVGVCSFLRLSQGAGLLPRQERRLIVAGTALGVLVGFLGTPDLLSPKAPTWDYS